VQVPDRAYLSPFLLFMENGCLTEHHFHQDLQGLPRSLMAPSPSYFSFIMRDQFNLDYSFQFKLDLQEQWVRVMGFRYLYHLLFHLIH